jgi:hypothetical protein
MGKHIEKYLTDPFWDLPRTKRSGEEDVKLRMQLNNEM